MNSTNRIKIIDILRGWALLVVVICNYSVFAYDENYQIIGKGFVSKILQTLEKFLFSAKGWSLLFVLFGFGFGVFMDKFQGNSYLGFIKRMFILFVFAFVNSIIYDGDILRDYAFLGLLILFFYKLSAKKILIIASMILFFIPFLDAYINALDMSYVETQIAIIAPLRYSHSIVDLFKFNFWSSYYFEVVNLGYSVTAHCVMFVCMLLGLWAQKTNFFEKASFYPKRIKKIILISFVSALVLSLILFFSFQNKATYLAYFSPNYWIVLLTMIFTTACICLLFLKQRCRTIFGCFSIVGRMTLTNYMVQNLISFFIFQGFGLRLFYTLPYYCYFLIAVGVYILQIFFSFWWLKSNNYGPLEILWRRWSCTISKP
ncbi:DUF418 domain-containing protein [Flavobacterium sp.]|uniref:DUF418 domain-containing protein n=1 Tax=Flavobacterium sp. TaxID=239 RepID=UPI00286B49D4|nr:DUF418 domain-containing protein [Flavobacterium sp.]